MIYRLSKALVYCFLKLFYGFEVKGEEAIPKAGPFILASNHLSNLDPPTIAASSPRKIGFLAKKELFKSKLGNFYLKSVGAIPVDRGKNDIRIMRLALKTLESKPLLIFPQGTRGGSLVAANNGIGFFHKKSAVPIIAVRIYGTDKALPKGAKFFGKGKVKVVFARVDNIKNSDNYENITQKVMTKIETL